MHLIYKIRPLLNTAEKRKEMDELKSEYDELKKQLEIETKERKKIEEAYVELVQMKNQLIASMNGEGDALGLMIKYIKIENLNIFLFFENKV